MGQRLEFLAFRKGSSGSGLTFSRRTLTSKKSLKEIKKDGWNLHSGYRTPDLPDG